MSHPKRVIIFANGLLADPQRALISIRPEDTLIAADGGAYHCQRLGLTPAVVIGDMDSLSPSQQEALAADGTRFVVHPRDKDQTDLELALSYAIQQGADEILLFGLLGGRLDQTLANLLLLARPEWKPARLIAADGADTAYLLHSTGEINLYGQPGDTVSLIPLSPSVSGISTQGLRWSLHEASLHFGATLGVSNEISGAQAIVRVRQGPLLVIHRSIQRAQEISSKV